MTPPAAPINKAAPGVGVNGSAVIETRPASAPFRAIVRSALPPPKISEAKRAAIAPAAAAVFVFTKIKATALASSTLLTINSEPPLNPNQPNHKMNVPSVAKGMFAPGIALTVPSSLYLPLRAPRSITPASAAVAPHMCTTPDPAKSRKPASSNAPPPHFQNP